MTPADAGALGVLEGALKPLGFTTHRLKFSAPNTPDVENLYARLGTAAPNFCFAGHTDVVPVGDRSRWTVDPFGAEVIDGTRYGRGAADMKGAIAAFVAACARYLQKHDNKLRGSISLLITGDEEGPAINGTAKVLGWLKGRGEMLDACLVGEPTCPRHLGDVIKIGRRGSLSGRITVTGVQGHTAYPQNADNPLPRLVRMLGALAALELDSGTPHFQPSNLQLTTIDVGNNAIPFTSPPPPRSPPTPRHSCSSGCCWAPRRSLSPSAPGTAAGSGPIPCAPSRSPWPSPSPPPTSADSCGTKPPSTAACAASNSPINEH